jgi:hypothetical protein
MSARRLWRNKPKNTDTTISITVSGLSTGAQAANSFTGWSSPATSTVVNDTRWGATGKHLLSGSSSTFMAKSTGTSRDQEVSVWGQRINVYLRLTDAGKAIVFSVAPETGLFEVSVRSGIVEGTAPFGSNPAVGYTTLNTNVFITALGALASVPGYSASSNSGHYWTFGCEGLDVYLKYNGVEFWRTKQFWHLEPGRIALAAQSGYGFRDVTATHKVSNSLYSDLTTKQFDIRDFGFKKLSAVGSMSAGSNILEVLSNPGFAVGDTIIVPTGGEAGGGVPGERGVGGQWPSLLYATMSARNSDTTQSVGRICGVLENGVTYDWSGAFWVSPTFGNASTYYSKIVPKALMATITAISGTTFTLDQTATVSTTNAAVVSDCRPAFYSSFGHANSGFSSQTGAAVFFPVGRWAFGGYNTQSIQFSQCNFLTVRGRSKNNTVLYSPPGCTTFSLAVQQGTSPIVEDLDVRGNFRSDKGYMTRFDSLDKYTNGLININLSSCPGAVVRRVRTYNNQQAAVSFNFCSVALGTDIEIIHETGHLSYQQWAINVSDCANCVIDGVSIDCPVLFSGAETFRSTGSILRNITGRNALFSTNSSDGFLIENIDLYYEAGAGDGFYTSPASYPSNQLPLFDHNTNIDNTSGSTVGGGGIVKNFKIDVRGKVWSSETAITVFAMSGQANNILFEGQYPDKPVSQPAGLIIFPSGYSQARAVRCDAAKTFVVDGVRIINKSGNSPIGDTFGTPSALATIRNCVIDNQTAGGTQTNNITNAAYEAI